MAKYVRFFWNEMRVRPQLAEALFRDNDINCVWEVPSNIPVAKWSKEFVKSFPNNKNTKFPGLIMVDAKDLHEAGVQEIVRVPEGDTCYRNLHHEFPPMGREKILDLVQLLSIREMRSPGSVVICLPIQVVSS